MKEGEKADREQNTNKDERLQAKKKKKKKKKVDEFSRNKMKRRRESKMQNTSWRPANSGKTML